MQQLYRSIGCQSIYYKTPTLHQSCNLLSWPCCTMLPAIDGWWWHIINWTLMSCPRDEQITHHDWPFLYTVLLASAGRWPSSEQSNGHIPPPGTRSIGTLHNPADTPKLMSLVLLLLLLLQEPVSHQWPREESLFIKWHPSSQPSSALETSLFFRYSDWWCRDDLMNPQRNVTMQRNRSPKALSHKTANNYSRAQPFFLYLYVSTTLSTSSSTHSATTRNHTIMPILEDVT